MFQSPVNLHFRNCAIDTEIVGEQQQPVALMKLVLEPFTPELARELSDEIADHCFTKHRKIRREIDSLTFDLDEKQQHVTVRMAVDVEQPHAILRYVRVPEITITKRGGESGDAGERKKKKVAPPSEILRATLTALVAPDSRDMQEFLCRRIKNTFVFQFEPEDRELQFGPSPKEDDEDDDGEAQLELEETPAPKLKAITTNQIVAALSDVSIEMKPADIKRMDQAQRAEVLAWVDASHQIQKERGMGVTANDIPPAPAFVLNPALLREAPIPDPAAGDVLDEQKPKKERAPRRSSATFKNSPRKVESKKKGGRS